MVRIYSHFQLHLHFLALICTADGISPSSALGITQTSTIRAHTRPPYLSYNPQPRAHPRPRSPASSPPRSSRLSTSIYPSTHPSCIMRRCAHLTAFSVGSCITTQVCFCGRKRRGKEGRRGGRGGARQGVARRETRRGSEHGYGSAQHHTCREGSRHLVGVELWAGGGGGYCK